MGIRSIDKAAFAVIYKEHSNGVYQTALRYSGNHHVAEEIMQTVFMKLYMNLGEVNENAVVSWMLTTAKHIAINYRRGLGREVLKEELLYGEDGAFASDFNLEDDFIKKLYEEEYRELAENIFADLYHLNTRWYDAVTTTYFLEKPQKEVADIMGVKLEVLHSMLYRAKKWIKKNYEEQFCHLREE